MRFITTKNIFLKSSQSAQKVQNDEYQTYKQIFESHPTFKDYGTLRKINKSIKISDTQSELFVNTRLFLFDDAFIAQFKIQNKIRNTILQNVKIEIKHSGETFQVSHITPAKSISFEKSGQCYVGIKKIQDCEDLIAQQKFSADYFNYIKKCTERDLNPRVLPHRILSATPQTARTSVLVNIFFLAQNKLNKVTLNLLFYIYFCLFQMFCYLIL